MYYYYCCCSSSSCNYYFLVINLLICLCMMEREDYLSINLESDPEASGGVLRYLPGLISSLSRLTSPFGRWCLWHN